MKRMVIHLPKDLSISMLMDFYGELLTPKQRDALDLYYNQDFSLAEIAQHMDISRQGVRDFIKRGEKQLEDLENALGLARRFSAIHSEFDKAEKILIDLEKLEHSDAAEKKLRRLSGCLAKIKGYL